MAWKDCGIALASVLRSSWKTLPISVRDTTSGLAGAVAEGIERTGAAELGEATGCGVVGSGAVSATVRPPAGASESGEVVADALLAGISESGADASELISTMGTLFVDASESGTDASEVASSVELDTVRFELGASAIMDRAGSVCTNLAAFGVVVGALAPIGLRRMMFFPTFVVFNYVRQSKAHNSRDDQNHACVYEELLLGYLR